MHGVIIRTTTRALAARSTLRKDGQTHGGAPRPSIQLPSVIQSCQRNVAVWRGDGQHDDEMVRRHDQAAARDGCQHSGSRLSGLADLIAKAPSQNTPTGMDGLDAVRIGRAISTTGLLVSGNGVIDRVTSGGGNKSGTSEERGVGNDDYGRAQVNKHGLIDVLRTLNLA